MLVIQVDCAQKDELFDDLVKEMKQVAWPSKMKSMPNVKFIASQLQDSQSGELDTMLLEMNQKIANEKEGDVWYRVNVHRKNGSNSIVVELPDQYSTTGYDAVYPADYGSIYIRERSVEELETIIRDETSQPEILLFQSKEKDNIDYINKWSIAESVFSYITGWNRTGSLEVKNLDEEKMKELQEELGALSSLSFVETSTKHPYVYENLMTHGKLLDGDYEEIIWRLDTYYRHYTEKELAWNPDIIYQGSYYDTDGNLVVLIGMDEENMNFGPTVNEMKKIAWGEEKREMPPVRFAAAYLPADNTESKEQIEERKNRLRADVVLPDYVLISRKD